MSENLARIIADEIEKLDDVACLVDTRYDSPCRISVMFNGDYIQFLSIHDDKVVYNQDNVIQLCCPNVVPEIIGNIIMAKWTRCFNRSYNDGFYPIQLLICRSMKF